MIKATRKICSLRSLSLVATLFFLTVLNDKDSSSSITETYEKIDNKIETTMR